MNRDHMACVKFRTLSKLNKFQAPGSPQEALHLCLFSSSHGGIKKKTKRVKSSGGVSPYFSISAHARFILFLYENLGPSGSAQAFQGTTRKRFRVHKWWGLQRLRSYKFKKNFPQSQLLTFDQHTNRLRYLFC